MGGHHRIAVNFWGFFETVYLQLSSDNDPLPYRFTGFRFSCRGHLVELYRCHLDMKINPIQQRTAYFVQVFLHHPGAADTFFFGMVIITAGAGVHACNQHKISRIVDRNLGPGDGDPSFFERLPQYFKNCAFKFRQLIQKQYPIMGKGNLTWLRISPSTYQSDIADSMVGRAEGALSNKGRIASQLTCYRMDLCGL